MFTIQRNLYLNEQRRSKIARAIFAAPDFVDAVDPVTPEQRLSQRQALALINALPEDQRDVVALVTIEGFSYRETAQILGIAEGTVMSRLSRARARLRELLDGQPTKTRLRRVT